MTDRAARPLPPLNAVRAFEAAGRLGSFRAASEELGVTQSAVAQQVRGLEALLGVALLFRRSRGVAPTDAGRAFLTEATRALDAIAAAAARAKPSRMAAAVGLTPSMAAKWLTPRAARFAARHPTIELRIHATDRLQSIGGEGLDFAIRLASPPFPSGLRATELFDADLVAVRAPEPERAEDEDWPSTTALIDDAHGLWPRFYASALRRDPPPAPSMRLSQTALAMDSVAAGEGMALAPLALAIDDIAAGRLEQVGAAELTSEKKFYLLEARSAPSAPMRSALRAWLLDEADATRRSIAAMRDQRDRAVREAD